MAVTNGYTTLADLRGVLGIPDTAEDTRIEAAINAASRGIDLHCRRRFHADTTATARVYGADATPDGYVLHVDDFHTTTGLVVATDDTDDGTFETTWAATDYQLEPLNGIVSGVEGWPYTRLVAIGRYLWPAVGRRARARITAKWGWAAVPEPVRQASQLVAADLWKQKDAPFGVAGTGEYGVLRILEQNPTVRGLLAGFRKAV